MEEQQSKPADLQGDRITVSKTELRKLLREVLRVKKEIREIRSSMVKPARNMLRLSEIVTYSVGFPPPNVNIHSCGQFT